MKQETKRYRRFGLRGRAQVVFFFSVTLLLNGVSFAGDSHQLGGDSLFENQILSMTAPKPELKPSGDPRFKDNEDGTVTDLEEGLMWKQQDSYQEKKRWINWVEAHDYVREKNENKFAGYEDWRLPTRKELLSLYEKEKSVPWSYYWTTNEVHIDPIFGYTSCCFWTSETSKGNYAWHVNFIRGKAYLSIREGAKGQAAGSLSLSVIRLVRKVEPAREAKASK